MNCTCHRSSERTMDYGKTEGMTEHKGFYLDKKQPKFYWNSSQIKMCSTMDINPQKDLLLIIFFNFVKQYTHYWLSFSIL